MLGFFAAIPLSLILICAPPLDGPVRLAAANTYVFHDGEWYLEIGGHLGSRVDLRSVMLDLAIGESIDPGMLERYQIGGSLRPRRFDLSPVVVHLAASRDPFDELEKIKALPSVRNARFEMYATLLATPDDELFENQWGLTDSFTGAPSAWDINSESEGITVAIIDTGTDPDHPDLVNSNWINSEEYSGETGVDDDENGYIDDVIGYDFYNMLPDPVDSTYYISNGHGTPVAGIIGAETDNDEGIAGVAGGWDATSTSGVRLMHLKVGTEGTEPESAVC